MEMECPVIVDFALFTFISSLFPIPPERILASAVPLQRFSALARTLGTHASYAVIADCLSAFPPPPVARARTRRTQPQQSGWSSQGEVEQVVVSTERDIALPSSR